MVNTLSFAISKGLMVKYDKENEVFEKIALCPTGVIDANQWYRFLTSEITHGSVGHIMCNMGIFLVWGMDIERTYGTAYYAALNVMIGTLSNFMSIGI